MRKLLKFIVAAIGTMVIAVFIWANTGHYVNLRLLSEYQVNVLILMGISFFGGMVSVILFNLWRDWRKHAEKNRKKSKRQWKWREEGL